MQHIHYYDKDGLPHGEYKVFYDVNGKPWERGFHKHGKLHGEYKCYYSHDKYDSVDMFSQIIFTHKPPDVINKKPNDSIGYGLLRLHCIYEYGELIHTFYYS